MYKFIGLLAIASLTTFAHAQEVKPGSTTAAAMRASPTQKAQAKKVAEKTVKAVYHVNTDVNTVPAILNNVRNHLNADPKAKIVVVTHGPGINFLIQDAKDSQGREFSGAVSELAGRGVEFRVCNNTLTSRNIDPGTLLMEAKIVPSGVSEVARLQALEGYVYLKP
jgi:intracellular sulfur oxidation DsrE/DsrF family protein